MVKFPAFRYIKLAHSVKFRFGKTAFKSPDVLDVEIAASVVFTVQLKGIYQDSEGAFGAQVWSLGYKISK